MGIADRVRVGDVLLYDGMRLTVTGIAHEDDLGEVVSWSEDNGEPGWASKDAHWFWGKVAIEKASRSVRDAMRLKRMASALHRMATVNAGVAVSATSRQFDEAARREFAAAMRELFDTCLEAVGDVDE